MVAPSGMASTRIDVGVDPSARRNASPVNLWTAYGGVSNPGSPWTGYPWIGRLRVLFNRETKHRVAVSGAVRVAFRSVIRLTSSLTQATLSPSLSLWYSLAKSPFEVGLVSDRPRF